MSREAIESFVDEIRDELPRMRRAFAIIHAWPDDQAARWEAHRLTHSIKGAAALVGTHTLGEIADRQETLIELLIDGRLSMNDGLRDTLERLADLVECYADSLQAGTVPEQRLLAEAIELSSRHAVVSNETAFTDGFRDEVLSQLRTMAEMLDAYRRDLTRWDLLADVRLRLNSLQLVADADVLQDFTTLAQHSEQLLQRVLDRDVPPSESVADCLQACLDALEQRLEQDLDEAILQQLHERLDELSHEKSADSELVPTANEPLETRASVVSEVTNVVVPRSEEHTSELQSR